MKKDVSDSVKHVEITTETYKMLAATFKNEVLRCLSGL